MDVLSAAGAVSRGLGLAKSLMARVRPQSTSFRMEAQGSPGENLMTRFDGNQDGTLSLSELKVSKAVFAQLDANKDGQISVDELNAGIEHAARSQRVQAGLARYMELHDSNGDGNISLAESGMDKSDFRLMDVNGDSALARRELAAPYRARGLDVVV